MNNNTNIFTTPEINGTWNSYCGDCDQMSDLNGDNTDPPISNKYYSSSKTKELIDKKINDDNEANDKTYSSAYTNKLYYKTYNEFLAEMNGAGIIKIEDSLTYIQVFLSKHSNKSIYRIKQQRNRT